MSKIQDEKKSMSGLKSLGKIVKMLLQDHKFLSILVGICIIAVGIISMSQTLFLNRVLTLIESNAAKFGTLDSQVWEIIKPEIIKIAIAMIVVYSLCVILILIYTQVMVRITQKFLNDLRLKMFTKMQYFPIKYFDVNQHGNIMSRYTNDVDSLRQFVSQTLPHSISVCINLLVAICIMLFYSIYLFLIVLLSSIIMLIVTKKVGGNSAKSFMKQQISTGEVEGFIEEMMHGQKVIKVFNHEQASIEDFKIHNEKLFQDAKNANKYGNILGPILNNIGHICYSLIAITGILLYINKVNNVGILGIGVMTIATIITFLPISKQFSQSINQLSQEVNMIAMAMAGAGRVIEFLHVTPEVDEGYVTLVYAKYDENNVLVESEERTGLWAWKHPHTDGTLTYKELKGDIVLENVDFGYNENKIVLHEVDVYAYPGQKIAFVGATGAGKTTITNLINRFYDIADGKIRYDGININKIKKSALRKSLGIVLQDTNLFKGTVMENIRYGNAEATDEEVYEAAKIANAYDFITRLPEGFNTMLVADGVNLSQGQRQLISIARAACADAPVMIMDEATSSIDTRTEALVQKGTDQLMEGRTVFVIAHRLSTVQNSDCIMVLDHGRIIERGSHASLIAEKGVYYQLYTGAFELE